MENLDVSRTLSEVADLLEIQGANPFRIRAYRGAVRTVEGLTRPIADMVADGEDLTELQGIGKQVDAHIRELLQTGQLRVLDEITEQIPRTLVELTRLDGVGPKKAKKLWEELGVESVPMLEAELDKGTVEKLTGFGAKSVAKIRRSIEDFRKQTGRFLRAEAEQLIAGLLRHMESAPGVERLDVAGSYRRRKETVGDVDLLVSCPGDGQVVVDHFVAFSGAVRVEAAGSTKGNVVLPSGLSVDLRVIPPRSYGAALHYFTGSKEHNVRVRTMAVKRGLRVNEWGVFRIPEGVDAEGLDKEQGERLGGATEEEVFAALDLPWIAPELREDRGEFDAAHAGRLPKLVSLQDVRGDLHMHSTWSDGTASILKMARACRERGYGYMAITDHSRAVTVANGLSPDRVRQQWGEVAEAQEAMGEDFRIFRGQEVDILKDGSLDQPDELLEELDLVIVSIHSFMDMDRQAMTRRVIQAIRHPQVDILAHPTGRLLNRREPYDLDVESVLEAAEECGVAVEVNAHPRRLDLNDVYLRRAGELGVTVVVNTDAHSVAGLDVMRFGVDQARRGWLEPEQVLNCGSAEAVASWLDRPR
jgi:DNA polymerase (family 10)